MTKAEKPTRKCNRPKLYNDRLTKQQRYAIKHRDQIKKANKEQRLRRKIEKTEGATDTKEAVPVVVNPSHLATLSPIPHPLENPYNSDDNDTLPVASSSPWHTMLEIDNRVTNSQ
ncbi:hypothetical protein CPC08DRAFT_810152 [Agrocybe pediades]|nr:hypothetical protein CPC08DRAFT_810152 [Agrocybe pediades]